MNKRHIIIAAAVICLLGVIVLAFLPQREVIIVIDGIPNKYQTNAQTVDMVLATFGLNPSPYDHIQPDLKQRVQDGMTITYDHAARVSIWTPIKGIVETFYSYERIPSRLFALGGIELKSEDRIFWNGQLVIQNESLPRANVYLLELLPANEIHIMQLGNDNKSDIWSAASTIGKALWENGTWFTFADSVSVSLNKPLDKTVSLAYQKAVPVYIQVDGLEKKSLSSAATVGKALSDTGLSLENMDYSIPAEELPLPENALIRLVRVREEVVIEQTSIPYSIERRPDPEIAIGQEVVIEEGKIGLQVTRMKIRYEDQQEVSRLQEAQWIVSNPERKLVSYGTQVVSQPVGTSGESQDYWASTEMYATSYYPCGFSNGRCSYITASGMTLKKGIVAMSVEWYKALRGVQVYIPGYGYGVIADSGGGIPGKNWIDLGYGNDDYVPWSQTVTVYFLNPPPAEIPWFLQ